MDTPATEDSGIETIRQSGWVFFAPSNNLALDVMPPAIMEKMRASETDVVLFNGWRMKLVTPAESADEQPELPFQNSDHAEYIELAEADRDLILTALLDPPAPTPHLIAALRRQRTAGEG
jgi:hypothetical protein